MKDLKILEKTIKTFKKNQKRNYPAETFILIDKDDIDAIENLINRVKELEEDNKYLKEQIPIDKIFYYSDKDYIPKSKIKEKIEEINNEKLNYSEDEYYLENEIKGYAIDKIQELLEE